MTTKSHKPHDLRHMMGLVVYGPGYLNNLMDGTIHPMVDDKLDAILDAVIEALPEKLEQTTDETDSDWAYGEGNNRLLEEITAILTAAKSPDRDQVKEGV